MRNQRGFIQIPIFVAIIASVLVVGSMGYFIAKRVNKSSQVIPSEEVLKNSNKESTTTTAVDANSAYLKEEMARKRQRDIDREQCIADAEREETEALAGGGMFAERALRTGRTVTPMKENIDRCYFRFPNN
ncbi:MAG: hypothetical protein AAB516_00570 [Patescibacteria group bacterium]